DRGRPGGGGQPAQQGAGREHNRGGQSRSRSHAILLRSCNGEWRTGTGCPARATIATARRTPFHSARRNSASAFFSFSLSADPSFSGAISISIFLIVPSNRNGAL